jgi:hypothetical protein
MLMKDFEWLIQAVDTTNRVYDLKELKRYLKNAYKSNLLSEYLYIKLNRVVVRKLDRLRSKR